MVNDDWPGLYSHDYNSGEEDEHEALRMVNDFVGQYARSALEDLRVYRQAAERMKQVDDGIELGGMSPWPERAWQRAFEQVWMAGVRLIWSSFQVEQWYERHRQMRGLPQRPNFAVGLRTVRNVLEHLDELKFEWGGARRNPVKKRQSVDDLGGYFPIGWSPSFSQKALGYFDLDEIEGRFRRFAEFDEPREEREWEPPTP